jgi:hypothetical protein
MMMMMSITGVLEEQPRVKEHSDASTAVHAPLVAVGARQAIAALPMCRTTLSAAAAHGCSLYAASYHGSFFSKKSTLSRLSNLAVSFLKSPL